MKFDYTLNQGVSQPTPPPLNSREAADLIIERAQQLVNQLITKRGNDKPPFLSEEYSHLLGVMSVEKAKLGKIGGVLLRLRSGTKIKINQSDSLVRQNFSCSHEIGHLLFSELKLENYIKTIEYRTYNPQAQKRTQDKAIEKLCDIAATELLMPASIFKKYINDLGTSIHTIERLAELFRVSIQSAAIRSSELSPQPCIAAKWELQSTQSKSLKLSWPKNKIVDEVNFSPLHKIIEPPSTMHKAYYYESTLQTGIKDSIFKDSISFKVAGKTKRFPAEIKGFGSGENRYVLSLAFLDR
jgi:Zn-dependent peptidase ImmA (M78 family)